MALWPYDISKSAKMPKCLCTIIKKLNQMKSINIISTVITEQIIAEQNRIKFAKKAIRLKAPQRKAKQNKIIRHEQNLIDLELSKMFLRSLENALEDLKSRDKPLSEVINKQLQRNGLYWNNEGNDNV